MARPGYDLQLTRYDERGWRATFYTTGMEHSPTSATGTGWERTTGTRSSSSPNPVSYRYTWRVRVRRESSSAAWHLGYAPAMSTFANSRRDM